MSDKIPWVIRGELGPATLTKWDEGKPVGYEPWCGTCGWHGQLYASPDDLFLIAEAKAHLDTTGHVYQDTNEEDELRYNIVRFHFDSDSVIVRENVTLEEAHRHCSRADTHGDGWFDGYVERG